MKFVYPEFLFALLALSIPVIIHLFNFRKFKKVYFTNVRFLTEIQQETKSKSRLKHLLVLFSRMLAILFMVLAFAQPYIPLDNITVDKSEKLVGIYIDNSFSMEAINKNGSLLDEAKKRAKEIAKAYKSTDQFRLFTNDFEAKHQRSVSREEFIELVDEVQISPNFKKLSEIVSRQNEMNNEIKYSTKKSVSFILSDFQKTVSDIENIKTDSAFKIHFVPILSQQQNNLYIDSCWFTSPVRQLNQPLELIVKIKNDSKNEVENVPVKLTINGQQKSLSSFSIDPGLQTDIKLSFTISESGWQNATITISDNPITFDDNYYLSFDVAKNLPVLCINGDKESSYINAVYGQSAFFLLKNSLESQLDYSAFPGNRLIVLNELKNISTGLVQELKRYVENGGNILVFPHPESDLKTYNSFFHTTGIKDFDELSSNETRIEKLNLDHSIFKNVFDKEKIKTENTDLPIVRKHFTSSRNNKTSEEMLLGLQNGESFLSKYVVGKGKIYVFSSSLNPEFTNFMKHALFAPTLYNIALLSGKTTQLSHVIGKDDLLELDDTPNGDNVFHLTKEKFDIIPEHKIMDSKAYLLVHNQVKDAGNYKVLNNKKEVCSFSFNFDRSESDLKCLNTDELNKKINDNKSGSFNIIETKDNDLSITLNEINQGIRLWKICIILALVFLGAEILLLRYLKG